VEGKIHRRSGFTITKNANDLREKKNSLLADLNEETLRDLDHAKELLLRRPKGDRP